MSSPGETVLSPLLATGVGRRVGWPTPVAEDRDDTVKISSTVFPLNRLFSSAQVPPIISSDQSRSDAFISSMIFDFDL